MRLLFRVQGVLGLDELQSCLTYFRYNQQILVSILTILSAIALFPVVLIKKVFTNDDGSKGILYLASNDDTSTADQLYSVYQKRWRIEEYHKSIKQNASLAKSPTKKVRSQCNHIFCSLISYCKLEFLKIKTTLNHFAIKYKLILKANQITLKELQNMRKQHA